MRSSTRSRPPSGWRASTGHGVEADAVRARISGGRVEMPGVLVGEALERRLRRAQLGVVSQRADVAEFNLPSKLMNYMAYGLPVLASVRPDSETARIVRDSGGGWVTDAGDPSAFADAAAEALARPEQRRGACVRRAPLPAGRRGARVRLGAAPGHRGRAAVAPSLDQRSTLASWIWRRISSMPKRTRQSG
jgi:glycosyltransferase involved in cell wall biosynthesis